MRSLIKEQDALLKQYPIKDFKFNPARIKHVEEKEELCEILRGLKGSVIRNDESAFNSFKQQYLTKAARLINAGLHVGNEHKTWLRCYGLKNATLAVNVTQAELKTCTDAYNTAVKRLPEYEAIKEGLQSELEGLNGRIAGLSEKTDDKSKKERLRLESDVIHLRTKIDKTNEDIKGCHDSIRIFKPKIEELTIKLELCRQEEEDICSEINGGNDVA